MKRRLLIIIIAFCISFVLMIGLSLFSLERFTTFKEYSQRVYHTNTVINAIYQTEGLLKDLDRTERGYVLTRDTSYLTVFNSAVENVWPALSTLQSITRDDPGQMKSFALLKSAVALRINFARHDMTVADSTHSTAPNTYYYEGRKNMVEALRLLRTMSQIENNLLAERFQYQQFYQRLTTTTLKYLLVIFCVVTLCLFVLMVRELKGRIRYQEELQARVIDLRRSHSELQEIAYVASHDLQEPLRKIQVFSNMLAVKRSDSGIDEDARRNLMRINSSASRMHQLINDLTSLTSLTKIDEEKQGVDLDTILRYVLIDIDDKVKEKHASVEVLPLTKVCGYENQLKILFRAILDNALKFTREGVKPVITINCDVIYGHELADINANLFHTRFYRITCSDNGIGFDNKFADKMFRIFQRLHNQQSEYGGKGIGLAICQRIMANHEGYILAHGVPGAGAQFKLFFPVDDKL